MPSGQWRSSTRRARLPKDWRRIRRQVFERDGWRCTVISDGARCIEFATDVDHVVPGDDHHLSNLRASCARHHALKSAAEGVGARARLPQRRRPREQHPGLVALGEGLPPPGGESHRSA